MFEGNPGGASTKTAPDPIECQPCEEPQPDANPEELDIGLSDEEPCCGCTAEAEANPEEIALSDEDEVVVPVVTDEPNPEEIDIDDL